MKFLINNYSAHGQTEAYYFNAGLNLIDGYQSTIWDTSRISAYDIMDMIKPDVFITHVSSIPTDLIRYVQENKYPLKFIINVTSSKEEDVLKIESFLNSNKIDVAFFFSNHDQQKIQTKRFNFVNIPLGVDLFLDSNPVKYNIDKGIFITSKDQYKNYDGTYHYISEDLKSNYSDIKLHIGQLAGIYKNYNEIIFRYFNTLIPQLFFDAAYRCNKVSYDLDDSGLTEALNNRFKKLLKIDANICSLNDNQAKEVKIAVMNKHTCLHRLKTLLSQLPNQSNINNIDKLIEFYTSNKS